MSLLLNFLCFIIFLRDKLIYYISCSACILFVEVALVLKIRIKTASTSGIDKLLSHQNRVNTQRQAGE
jgi:hypothetical protein